jgi:hypothetical protein
MDAPSVQAPISFALNNFRLKGMQVDRTAEKRVMIRQKPGAPDAAGRISAAFTSKRKCAK